jgi:hypothetical protein
MIDPNLIAFSHFSTLTIKNYECLLTIYLCVIFEVFVVVNIEITVFRDGMSMVMALLLGRP